MLEEALLEKREPFEWKNIFYPTRWVASNHHVYLEPEATMHCLYTVQCIGSMITTFVTADSFVAFPIWLGAQGVVYLGGRHFISNRVVKELHERAIEEIKMSDFPKEAAMQVFVHDGGFSGTTHKGKGIQKVIEVAKEHINKKSEFGSQTLMSAVCKESTGRQRRQFAEALLDAGAQVQTREIIAAVRSSDLELIKLLWPKYTYQEADQQFFLRNCASYEVFCFLKENAGLTVKMLEERVNSRASSWFSEEEKQTLEIQKKILAKEKSNG